jgi:glycosyltransferase involved in cell wall biosynthesis
MMDELLAHCGVDSAIELIQYNLDVDELNDLLEELIANDQSGIVRDLCEEIAKQSYNWVDWERLQSDAEDAAYQRLRDMEE